MIAVPTRRDRKLMRDSIREFHRRRLCTRKKPFEKLAEANRVRLGMQRQFDRPYNVYRCAFGSHWHIGKALDPLEWKPEDRA